MLQVSPTTAIAWLAVLFFYPPVRQDINLLLCCLFIFWNIYDTIPHQIRDTGKKTYAAQNGKNKQKKKIQHMSCGSSEDSLKLNKDTEMPEKSWNTDAYRLLWR